MPTPTLEAVTLPVLSEDYPVGEAPVFTEAELDQVLSTVWQLPCADEYRRMLLRYEGREEFGVPVVERLWHEFLELRPECAAEGGELEAAKSSVCANSPFGESTKGSYFTEMLYSGTDWPAVYVNFLKMPFDGRLGCWIRDRGDYWRWLAMEPIPGKIPEQVRHRNWREAERGVFQDPYPACDELLRIMLPRVAAARGGLDTAAVAAAVDRVNDLVPDDCASHRWELYPQDEPHAECEVQSPTGPLPEGGYVIHWEDPSIEASGRPCWVMGEIPGS